MAPFRSRATEALIGNRPTICGRDREGHMMTSHQDVTTMTTGSNSVAYRYPRVGTSVSSRPLVLLQHFRVNPDNWDPELVDALAEGRETV
jgi:hypothetical protein